MARAFAARLACVSITPFGRPVVRRVHQQRDIIGSGEGVCLGCCRCRVEPSPSGWRISRSRTIDPASRGATEHVPPLRCTTNTMGNRMIEHMPHRIAWLSRFKGSRCRPACMLPRQQAQCLQPVGHQPARRLWPRRKRRARSAVRRSGGNLVRDHPKRSDASRSARVHRLVGPLARLLLDSARTVLPGTENGEQRTEFSCCSHRSGIGREMRVMLGSGGRYVVGRSCSAPGAATTTATKRQHVSKLPPVAMQCDGRRSRGDRQREAEHSCALGERAVPGPTDGSRLRRRRCVRHWAAESKSAARYSVRTGLSCSRKKGCLWPWPSSCRSSTIRRARLSRAAM